MKKRSRGFGLIDGLIALAILAFGLLGMTRLQARALAQATESQSRTTASLLADELLSSALIDTLNRDCYTLPAAGSCGSTPARNLTNAWKVRLQSSLRDGAVTSTLDGTTRRLTLVITWTGKESATTRRLEATTDLRRANEAS